MMKSSSTHERLTLFSGPIIVSLFTPLLQEGVQVEADVDRPLRSFLCDQLELDPLYVDERIQTVFLDGKPVDRLEAATVQDGAVVALSASLPGLLGATLRKAGFYASLRRGISYEESESEAGPPGRRGRVTLKVFNVLLKEIAPGLLRRGVTTRGDRVSARLRMAGAVHMEAIRAAELNGQRFDPKGLPDREWGADVLVTVCVLDPDRA